jgi:2-iminobutanoate/2-iminopropanoate deaminase
MRAFVLSAFSAAALAACASGRPRSAVVPAGAPSSSSAPNPEYIAPNGPSRNPFTPVVRVGSTLYLSGQLGTDSTGKLAPGGIGPETRAALENIKRLVLQNGSSMDRIVKCTVMMADMKEWPAMNEVYATFFSPQTRPARSAFGATGLALNGRLEIECIAIAN